MSEIPGPKLNRISQSWSDLPEDLLEEITARLASADRVRFGAVCRNFFQYYYSLLSDPKHNHWAIDRLPWLLRPCRDQTELFDPIHQHLYYVHKLRLSPTTEHFGTNVLASKDGWLLCSKEAKEENNNNTPRVSFYSISLFTKQLIRLPDLCVVQRRSRAKFIRLAAFSSDPSSPDCVYFVVHQNIRNLMLRISTLQHGAGSWIDESYHAPKGLVCGVVYHERCFYLVTKKGYLESYDVVSRNWTIHTGFRPLLAPVLRNDHIRQYHVVLSGHELLLVCLDIVTSKNHGDNQVDDECTVFEFSRSSRTWVKKTCQGDRALFLGCSSFSVSANRTRTRGIDIANKVYYYHPSEANEPRYFSFDDCKCHKSTSSCWFGDIDAGMWIEPPQLPKRKCERLSQL